MGATQPSHMQYQQHKVSKLNPTGAIRLLRGGIYPIDLRADTIPQLGVEAKLTVHLHLRRSWSATVSDSHQIWFSCSIGSHLVQLQYQILFSYTAAQLIRLYVRPAHLN
ncbi:hypothetical protein F511_44688 [Dorcoceras hygrometricum]|uniref:Uncharacterized protein n=1 Tax=Dorcoceras hygrometricum TaxID=472368 RepID=A0A2Z6ZXJ0_9LAMI|nr:hypothetical protein F511_44688 [Dorcoceras hygrometricum]